MNPTSDAQKRGASRVEELGVGRITQGVEALLRLCRITCGAGGQPS